MYKSVLVSYSAEPRCFVKQWRDLEIGVRGPSRSLKMSRSIDHIRFTIGLPL